MALKKTARELKNEAHMKAIVQSAASLFHAYGFERVTVDDICEAAKVSKSTFYNLYKSKDGLLMLCSGEERCTYISSHYHYDEHRPLRELFKEFFQVNYDYTRANCRDRIRQVYKSYMMTGTLMSGTDQTYSNELYVLIHRALHEGLLNDRLTADDHFRLITDSMIGCFIGWCTHIEDEPGLDEQYQRIVIALADSLLIKGQEKDDS